MPSRRQRDDEPAKPRVKGIYVGAPACFALELACQHLMDAFGAKWENGCYVVGSALERPDWRDIDVRLIMSDDEFAKLFPDAGPHGHWEHDPRWLLLTTWASKWLSDQSGLPVDFQFQAQTHANEKHRGVRNAIGFRTPD